MSGSRPTTAHPMVIGGLALAALPITAELALRMNLEEIPRVGAKISEILAPYVAAKAYCAQHWHGVTAIGLLGLVLGLIVLRQGLLFWRNTVVAKISGAALSTGGGAGFPKLRFDLKRELARTPQGKYFLGLDAQRKPVYLSEFDLDTHGHIMGHTGSGKTQSVLEPLMFQDIRAGKGVLFMDAKGSAENVAMVKSLAAVASRAAEVRIFALAYPEWSQTYNPVFLGHKGDPLATAERVFSVFALSHEYYGGQAKLFFYNLLKLLAGTGKPFNLADVRICVGDDDMLAHVADLSDEKRAWYEIESQLRRLKKRREEVFTGLYNALAEYDHPLLNSYAPEIVLEDIINERGIVYFNLPANRYALLAPAIGKIVLQHVKAIGALRQIDREHYDQYPFAVNIDELNRFAFDELVPSLAMLRDARMQFRLSHQSLGDLDQVSTVFARQVKDNTRWKAFLFENDAEHLEKVSKAFGTRTTFKKTVRYSLGPLLTFLNTGEVSNREVEEFILHPNALKSLAPRGQGYVLLPDAIHGVNFEILPRFRCADYPLPRNRPGHGLNLEELCMRADGEDDVAEFPELEL